MKRIVGFVVMCGCGGGGGSPAPDAPVAVNVATVTGTIAGASVVIASVLSGPGKLDDWPTTVVELTNTTDACAGLATNPFPASQQRLTIALVVFDANQQAAAATTPGHYDVDGGGEGGPPPPGNYAWVSFDSTNLSCVASPTTISEMGAVDVSTLTFGADGLAEVAGTFDLVLFPSDHITGTFSSVACPAFAGSATAPNVPCH